MGLLTSHLDLPWVRMMMAPRGLRMGCCAAVAQGGRAAAASIASSRPLEAAREREPSSAELPRALESVPSS